MSTSAETRRSAVPRPRPMGLDDPARLAAIEATGLDAGAVDSLDLICALTARLLTAPTALVTLVSPDGQRIPGAYGLSDPAATSRQMTPPYSYCQFTVLDQAPLRVPDARLDPRLRDSPAIREHQHIAYAGQPLRDPSSNILGALCVIDTRPRTWLPQELETLASMAASAETEIALALADRRLASQARAAQELASRLEHVFLEAVLDSMTDGVVACDADGHLVLFNRVAREMHGDDKPPDDQRDWPAAYHLYRPDGETLSSVEELPLVRALAGESVTGHRATIRLPGQQLRHVETIARPIVSKDARIMGAFATFTDVTERLALADERTRLRDREEEQTQRLLILQERERIATAIHDGVLQRLYASGLHLRRVGRSLPEPAAVAVSELLAELDVAARDIRGIVFGSP